LAARSYTPKELKKIREVYDESETHLEPVAGAAHFEGNKQLL
jgi:hypothetical protein